MSLQTARGPDNFQSGIVIQERDGKHWRDRRDEFGVVRSRPEGQWLLHLRRGRLNRFHGKTIRMNNGNE